VKRAVSISLGSSTRDKRVIVEYKGDRIALERIGTDGDVVRARRLFAALDGAVDALGVGGVDLYLRLDGREYPLRAALALVEDVRQTPVVDGRGLKHTLERRVFELVDPLDERPLRFRRAFIPMTVDRVGLAEAVSEVAEEVVFGDLIVGLGVPIPIRGIGSYRRVARCLFPIVSYFPMRLLYYAGSPESNGPNCDRHLREADLIAGDFLFMRQYLPDDLSGKTILTNTTTPENVAFLRARGVRRIITTTPRYDGRSFGTNLLEAGLTAYAGRRRPLSTEELSGLIAELDLRPTMQVFE